MSEKAAIIGVGQTRYRSRTPDKTYAELAQQAVVRALEHAGLTMDAIDAVVTGIAPSILMGVNSPQKWIADAIGAVGKPFMRINTGGTTGGAAAQAGYYHVASGLFKTVLVVSTDKVAESKDAQQVLNNAFDVVYERAFGLNALSMCSFQAVRHMHLYGTTERQYASIAARSRTNGLNNPYAHLKIPLTLDEALESPNICYPIKLADSCPRSSGACAMIIAAEDVVKETSTRPAWIRGLGACTNVYYMGDRMGPGRLVDHGDMDDLAQAARQAYEMAGVTDPKRQIDMAEIYAPFSNIEVTAVEALGFCEKGQGGPQAEAGAYDLDGEIPVNPSGGTICSNPISATALVRVADAALQIMGDAGPIQMANPQLAVATGIGGSVQFHTCMVLGADVA